MTCKKCLLISRELSGVMRAASDEFPRRLCDPLPPVTAVLYYRWLAADLHDKIIPQGVGGHRVYVGIRHPYAAFWLVTTILSSLYYCYHIILIGRFLNLT